MDKATADGWGDRDWEKMDQAIERLKKEGCVVILATGYVVWPTKEAEAAGRSTQQMFEDTHLVHEWS